MAATTITRATITDDDGSGTTGTIINASWVGTALYDKIDALFTGATIQQEKAAAAAGVTFCAKNTATDGFARLAGGTDDGADAATLDAFGSTYSSSGSAVASGARLTGKYGGGLALCAADAAGLIKFYPGGVSSPTTALLPVGHLWMSELATDPSSAYFSDRGDFALYMKNNKLVIAYKNSSTMTYITIPMDGSTTSWTHSTSAP